MNAVTIFQSPQFGLIRTAGTADNPQFCLKDVCEALGLTPKVVNQRLDDGVVSKYPITDNLGREQQALFVNEDGLYDVILDSRKPEAKAFRKWITSEVLPAIRKTGGYIASQEDDTPEMIMARALQVAQMTIEKHQHQLSTARAVISENAPKVAFADAVITSKSSCLIGELAKLMAQNGVSIGQNRLFRWMRDHGYLGKHGDRYNIPMQRYVEQGLFEIKQGVRTGHEGVFKITLTTKVTGKGQAYFVNKFLKEQEVKPYATNC